MQVIYLKILVTGRQIFLKKSVYIQLKKGAPEASRILAPGPALDLSGHAVATGAGADGPQDAPFATNILPIGGGDTGEFSSR